MAPATPATVVHQIEPVFDARSRVLVLGTMPSPASRAAGFYYGHPHNRFWPVVAGLWDEPVPEGMRERAAFALRHRFALWDVISSCEIAGASDASIRNAAPNDLARVTSAAPICAVATTGTKAAQLYRRLCAASLPDLPHIALPSTSGANARMSLANLKAAYAPLREAAEGRRPPRGHDGRSIQAGPCIP